jgi:hypothetical protein
MFYQKNVPQWERWLRIIASVLLAAYGLLGGLSPIIAGVVLFSAVFLLVTGFIGFCPACAMVGRKLANNAKKLK